MRNSSHTRFLAAFVIAIFAAAAWLALPSRVVAQRSATGLDTYAITNARIVTGVGQTIERGTVVFRNGLIIAVGDRVNAPPDARVIDGAGLTVYPGLIDASTTLGIPRPTPQPGGGAGGLGGGFAGLFGPPTAPSATSPNSTQLAGLQPEILAADIIHPGGAEIEAARAAGITAAQTVPRGNIFLGQSAFINLAGDTPQGMIIRTPVALYVGLTPLGSGQYPGSLMGVFSSIRQLLLDAQRYREANEIYARNPRGLRRPDVDKSLAALQPVLARQMPVVMQADRAREIDRALDLAREFNLQMIINGGMEADRVAPRLKAMNVPVLLSLNFPKRTTAASPDADPDPVRVLRERVEAPKTAGRLAAAGVPFAFQSGGMTTMTDFLTNAAKAVEQGLARDEALRAMTSRTAEMLGVADRLGTIETGKIANLTVTRGDLFDKTRAITHVFIDGRPVDLKPAAATTPASGAASASGTWVVNINLGGAGKESELTMTLTLQQQGERLSGSIQGQLGSGQIATGTLNGADIRFTVPVTLPGPGTQTTDANFTGTLNGNGMSGTVQVIGRGPGTFTGTRGGGGGGGATTTPAPSATPGAGDTPPARPGTTPPTTTTPPASSDNATTTLNLSGTWSTNVEFGQTPIPITFILQQQRANLSGRIESRFGSADIAGGAVTDNTFRFSTTLELQGQAISFNYEGTVSGDTMNGTVTTPRGQVPFSGTRSNP